MHTTTAQNGDTGDRHITANLGNSAPLNDAFGVWIARNIRMNLVINAVCKIRRPEQWLQRPWDRVTARVGLDEGIDMTMRAQFSTISAIHNTLHTCDRYTRACDAHPLRDEH